MEIVTKGNRVAFLMYLVATPANSDLPSSNSIMKMINKFHGPSMKFISLYVASSIVDIFVKNPKTLSTGHKVSFKVP
jgi:hypothetical protein